MTINDTINDKLILSKMAKEICKTTAFRLLFSVRINHNKRLLKDV